MGATADGSEAFFSAEEKLKAGAGEDSLYLYELPAKKLTNLTPSSEAVDVLGLAGISEDGSYVYFVAKGALTGAEQNSIGQKAQAGQANLYLQHEGEVSFVAGLSLLDEWVWETQPKVQRARVSEDGRHLAFVSVNAEELAGYDNLLDEDIGGGEHCQENVNEPLTGLIGSPLCPQAFIYDAESGVLRCASCNPSGARPLGPSLLPVWSNPLEGPRYLSEDGSRLLFESRDTLLLGDQNGKRDVYEFELPGAGSCSEGSPNFDPASGGCHFLISSGKSGDESFLLDASADGRDAFFATRQRLVGWDENDNYDVYDFRVGGGFPEPPRPPLVCGGEACLPAAPPPPSAPVPATPGFAGEGNVKPKPKKAKKKHKAKKRGNKSGKGKANKKRRASR